jgi:hypothetical protein
VNQDYLLLSFDIGVEKSKNVLERAFFAAERDELLATVLCLLKMKARERS